MAKFQKKHQKAVDAKSKELLKAMNRVLDRHGLQELQISGIKFSPRAVNPCAAGYTCVGYSCDPSGNLTPICVLTGTI